MNLHKLHQAVLKMPEQQLSMIHEAVENGGRIEQGNFYPEAFELPSGVADDLKGHTHSRAALARHLRVNMAGGSILSAFKAAGQYALNGAKKFGAWVRSNPAAAVKIGAGVTVGAIKIHRAASKKEQPIPEHEKVEALLADVLKPGGRLIEKRSVPPVERFYI